MKILHVSPGLQETCGVSQFVVNIARAQQIAGHTVVIVTTMTCGYPVEGLDVRLMPDPTKVDFTPEVVHIHTLWGRYTHKMAVWSRRHHLPYVISPHGALTKWALAYKWWKKIPALLAYQWWDLHCAKAFHVTAESELPGLRRLHLDQSCCIAPLGVWINSGPAADNPLPATETNIYRDVLFIGRIHPVKNLDGLIRAWSLLKHHSPPPPPTFSTCIPRLIIAGSNDVGHQEELVALAKSLDLKVVDFSRDLEFGKKQIFGGGEVPVGIFRQRLSNCDADVIFTGPVYAKAKDWMYAQSWVFVLPSHTENFGGVVVEALAQGTPVIASKGTPWKCLCGGGGGSPNLKGQDVVANVSKSRRCGWWVDATPRNLADAMEESLNMTEEVRKTKGRIGCELVESRYSWSAAEKVVSGLYERMTVRS